VDACLGSWLASCSGSGAKAKTPSSGYASSTRELRWRSPGRPRASTFSSLRAKATKALEEAGTVADRLIARLRNAPPWPGAAGDPAVLSTVMARRRRAGLESDQAEPAATPIP
jgi:hypothetical protein